MNKIKESIHYELSRIIIKLRLNFRLDIASFTPIWTKRINEGFLHFWKNGALVWHEITPAAKHITECDLSLFTRIYSPSKGDTIVIAGAGVGAELPFFSREIGDKGTLIAIEPDHDAFAKMSFLVEFLKLDNVKLLNLAVGDKTEMVSMHRDLKASATNWILKSKDESSNLIQSTTLAKILEVEGLSTVDYLKMNIEGSEAKALSGLGDVVTYKSLCVSCHDFLGAGFETFDEVLSMLNAFGYKVSTGEFKTLEPWSNFYVYGEKK